MSTNSLGNNLVDSFGRQISYVRIAVTDRCNLRCFYCMPSEGIQFVPREDLLSWEEMYRMVDILSSAGVDKVRITGGEPFVRKGIMEFLEQISTLERINKISITTNGTVTRDYIPRLKAAGIRSVNLSLDSLDRERFHQITRRDMFDDVMATFYELLDQNFEVKINSVVMEGKNIDDIYPMIELSKELPISVRFIEEMPFNGTEGQGNPTLWPMGKILEYIGKEYPGIKKLDDPISSTSYNYQIPGFKGTFGIIAAYSRTFCGSCNRIRLTPQGQMRNCLYSAGGVSFRELLRSSASDHQIMEHLQAAILNKPKDGFVAEKESDNKHQSMATIGG